MWWLLVKIWVFLSDRECWRSSMTLQEFYCFPSARIMKFLLHSYSFPFQSFRDYYNVAVVHHSSCSLVRMSLLS